MHRAVFVDRDGTVVVDHSYLATAEGIELLPGVGDALALLLQHGFMLVLVTNQSGIGRGYFPMSVVEAQHRRLAELLAGHGVRFAGIEVCPHAPWENCACRKPAPGLLRAAAGRLDIDLLRSFVVGDKPGDVLAGKAAGCTAIMVGGSCPEADYAAADLPAATGWIIAQTQAKEERV